MPPPAAGGDDPQGSERTLRAQPAAPTCGVAPLPRLHPLRPREAVCPPPRGMVGTAASDIDHGTPWGTMPIAAAAVVVAVVVEPKAAGVVATQTIAGACPEHRCPGLRAAPRLARLPDAALLLALIAAAAVAAVVAGQQAGRAVVGHGRHGHGPRSSYAEAGPARAMMWVTKPRVTAGAVAAVVVGEGPHQWTGYAAAAPERPPRS